MEEEVADGVIVNIEMIDEGERDTNNDKIIIQGNETDNGEEREKCTPFTEHFHRMDSLDKEASRVSGMPAASKVWYLLFLIFFVF